MFIKDNEDDYINTDFIRQIIIRRNYDNSNYIDIDWDIIALMDDENEIIISTFESCDLADIAMKNLIKQINEHK